MKVLLSAYACEPDKGSEPGVGWNWAAALGRRGYEVHVLTRSNNHESIERALGQLGSSIHFHFFDYPKWFRFWKYWSGGIYLYYLLWQIGAYRVARRLHAQAQFDLVQHITFVSYRQPSFMGGLGIPFIFGPVGGGESMPSQLRASLPLKARIEEALRNAGNRFVGWDPLMRHTYAAANVIVCATEETRQAIPAQFRGKCIVQRAIGINESGTRVPSAEETRGDEPSSGLTRTQFLFVGRLLYWKGLHLVLRALAQVNREIPEARLRVIGEGNDGHWLRDVAERARVTNLVEWVPRIAHSEMRQEYRQSASLVFPSLHDSGGMVVLESLAAGLPVICLDRGGPGSMVDSTCGTVVPTDGQNEAKIIDCIAEAMILLLREPEMRPRLVSGARQRARDLSWDAAVEGVYKMHGHGIFNTSSPVSGQTADGI